MFWIYKAVHLVHRYFPAKYAEKLNPGERVLRVSQGLEVTEGDGSLKLLKDQVQSSPVIQNSSKTRYRQPPVNQI